MTNSYAVKYILYKNYCRYQTETDKEIYSFYRIMRHLLKRGDCTYKSEFTNPRSSTLPELKTVHHNE